MKLGPITRLYKTTSKIFNDDVMSENCDVIITFSMYGQFEAILKPDSGCMVLVLKGIFCETTYVCVLTCQIRSFYQNFNKFQTGWSNFTQPHLKTNP